MKNEIEEQVKNFLNRHGEASAQELSDYIRQHSPRYTSATISTYLSRMKSNGTIFSNGRNIYTLSNKEKYQPLIAQRLKLIANKVKQDYPLLKFCIWDSKWLNEFMRHQLFRYMTVIEVEKDGVGSLFFNLSETNRKVFLNPDPLTFERYVTNYDDPIIIVPLISESPLEEANKVPTPSLEKLLVDIVADKNLYAAQQAELDFIYKTVLDKYQYNTNKLKRYAKRRNQLEKVTVLLDQANLDLNKK